MADISVYLAQILSAVYGEDVRGSIHDAIEIINDVSEVVLSTGTAITGPTSSSTGFYEDSLYLNTNTYELWKCVGTDTWASLGVLKGTQGAPGEDGNKWYRGTGISGKAVNPTVYSGSGITDANPNDFYLNPTEGAVYHCVTGGDASTATWSYDFTMSGGGGGGGGTTDYNDLTNKPQINSVPLSGNVSLTDLGLKAVASSGSYTDLTDKPSIPSAANNGQLTIQQNGTTKGTFTADQSANATVNISTTEEIAAASVSSGSVTFSGIDDTTNGGYDVYFDITSSSTNKSPYAKLTSVSGEGTSNMTLVYQTDADNGTNTAHLYKVK